MQIAIRGVPTKVTCGRGSILRNSLFREIFRLGPIGFHEAGLHIMNKDKGHDIAVNGVQSHIDIP